MWGKILKIALQAAGYVILNWKQIKPFYDDTIGKIFKAKANKNKPLSTAEVNQPEGKKEVKTKNS